MRRKSSTKLPETGYCVECGNRCTINSSVYVDIKSSTYNKITFPKKRVFMCNSCWNKSLKRGKPNVQEKA